MRSAFHLAVLLSLTGTVLSAQTHADRRAPVRRPVRSLPTDQHTGPWASGHVQGIAVDLAGGYIYYSFTDLLLKYNFSGRLIGSLTGWSGHLGDLDFNPADGRVYGSLEYKKDDAFYIAVVDVGRIDRVGLRAGAGDLMRTVYLPEVSGDYAARLATAGDGRALDHRYGCSGIDGVSFGPRFGSTGGPSLLTVAYGIFGDVGRTDNDHQVLLQYDVSDWTRYASPLAESAPHHRGPTAADGKYFVRTGNTTYGVQNLSYDPELRRWFLGVYRGTKPAFPNYLLFAVDARARPATGELIGVPSSSGRGWERGRLLPLADDGLADPTTGIRGWNYKADVGFQPVGGGLFYVAANGGGKGAQTADLTLMRWTGDARQPLVPARPGGREAASASSR